MINNYEMTRGDTFGFEVKITENNAVVEVDEMFLTIKNNNYIPETIIQKKLGAGIIQKDDAYYIIINPEDTDNLEYGRYVFDIEFIIDGIKRTIEKGSFLITDETTHCCNEV